MKINRLMLLLLVSMIGAASAVNADVNYKGRTEVGVRIGGLITEGNSSIDDEWLYGGQVAYNATEHVSVEAAILAGKSQLQLPSGTKNAVNTTGPSTDVEVLLPSIELLYNFTRNHFRPYVAAGVADIHTKASASARSYGRSSSKMDDLGALYGAGFKWLSPCGRMIWRTDVRHLVNTESAYHRAGVSKNNLLASTGLSWLFGGSSKCCAAPKAEKPAAPAPVAAAAPAPVAPPVVQAPADADKDGVADANDECPNTPAGTDVDATGCPKTVKAITDNWTLSGVQFETSSDKIKAESYSVLDEAAGILAARSNVRVEVQGHTDSLGEAPANLALSERRAKSVVSYLVSKGVATSQLEAKGYGETQPKADNKTKEGRAQNRRIDFKVLSR